jgi:hypothetical protein
MKGTNFVFKSLVLVTFFILGSCKNTKEPTSQIQKDNLSVSLLSNNAIEEIIYAIPDPDEIFNEIFTDNFDFNDGLINPIDKANELFEIKTIAMNFGVYLADMAYLIIQEKNTEALKYFETTIQLSYKLELQNFYDYDNNEIEQNINNKDSLYSKFKESVYNIKYELEYTKRNKHLALIYTGIIIETLYLAINNMDDNKLEIMEKILEQSIVVNNLYDFLSQYKEDLEMKSIVTQIDTIKYFMDKSKKQDSDISVQKNEQNQLIFKGGNEIDYNKEDFEFIKSKIIELREVIIYN